MRIVAEIPEYLIERARRLIGGGRYRDLSSFITAAVENQLTLEETVLEGQPAVGVEGQTQTEAVSKPSRPQANYLATPGADVPTIDFRSQTGESLVKQWPWGQINKLLPVKFATRTLANSVSPAEPLVPLDEFTADASQQAREFGQWLEKNDDRYERRWGDRLSAGFPIGKRNQASSLNRYASHFVGHHRKRDGALSGALFVLNFGNAEVVGRKLSLGLTEAGLQFARIASPVLDKSDLSSSLGREEIEFYLKHVRARVPGEVYAFELILELIADGVNGREGLNESIKREVQIPWTDAVVNTQRAGAMARMSDLGLIDKTRDGLKVLYQVTELGTRWLAGGN